MKIYLDSCVWIDYSWGMVNNTGRIKPDIQKVIDFIDIKNIRVVYSLFSNAELSAHIRDWFLLQKTMRDGHSYREFSRLKSHYSLSSANSRKIENISRKIFELPWVRYSGETVMGVEHFKAFETLTWAYQVDSIDAFHNIIARDSDCRLLVTKDEDMRNKMNKFLDDIDDTQYRVCTPKEFLGRTDI